MAVAVVADPKLGMGGTGRDVLAAGTVSDLARNAGGRELATDVLHLRVVR